MECYLAAAISFLIITTEAIINAITKLDPMSFSYLKSIINISCIK